MAPWRRFHYKFSSKNSRRVNKLAIIFVEKMGWAWQKERKPVYGCLLLEVEKNEGSFARGGEGDNALI